MTAVHAQPTTNVRHACSSPSDSGCVKAEITSLQLNLPGYDVARKHTTNDRELSAGIMAGNFSGCSKEESEYTANTSVEGRRSRRVTVTRLELELTSCTGCCGCREARVSISGSIVPKSTFSGSESWCALHGKATSPDTIRFSNASRRIASASRVRRQCGLHIWQSCGQAPLSCSRKN